MAKPDAIDRTSPAVDQFATRKSDGTILAIEHTIIEPFLGDKEDFAGFEAAFLRIEKDSSLIVHGRWLQIFVPVSALRKQPARVRDAFVESVHAWIRFNRQSLPFGKGVYACGIAGVPGKPPFEIPLDVNVTPLKRGDADEPGVIHVRRQQIDVNLGDVIEKALKKKLPKLVNTKADKHILLLERQHMNLLPEMILEELGKRRASFKALADVDEVWIIETNFVDTPFGGTYLRFERYAENGDLVQSYDFNEGRLESESVDGWPKLF
ncbi:MAG: hypothetical protein ABI693_34795 [Bryobacteraceae bacterium]